MDTDRLNSDLSEALSDGENFFLKKPKKNLAKNPLRN